MTALKQVKSPIPTASESIVFAIDLFIFSLVVAPFVAVALVLFGYSIGWLVLAIWFLACVAAVLIGFLGINFSL